jgi:hypothetical protein
VTGTAPAAEIHTRGETRQSVFDDTGDFVGSLNTGAEVVSAACASDGGPKIRPSRHRNPPGTGDEDFPEVFMDRRIVVHHEDAVIDFRIFGAGAWFEDPLC